MTDHLGQSGATDLTDLDREILDLLLGAEDEDGNYASMLGADIASCVGVKPNAIGSRLSSLVRRGYVRGWRHARWNVWCLTDAAIRGELKW